jgi:predicted transposase/invertase (TIGR01784 family)
MESTERNKRKKNSKNEEKNRKRMYLNPKADLTFKKVFGEHKHLMISFLNALLPLSEKEQISSIEYLTPELIPQTPLRKYSIVDVRCKDAQGRQFLVEMQIHWAPEFKTRVFFNAAKAYVRQADMGDNYQLFQPVWSLNLVNEVFEPDTPDYYHHYKVVNIKDTDKVIEGLQLVFVELPKFKPGDSHVKKMQELWLRFMTEINESTQRVPEELTSNADVKEAIIQLRESAFNDDELAAYDYFWDAVRLENAFGKNAEERGLAKGLAKGHAEGHAEGLAEGLAEGRAKGLAEGRAEGRAEGLAEGRAEGLAEGEKAGLEKGIEQTKLEIMKRLNALGLPEDLINKAIGNRM